MEIRKAFRARYVENSVSNANKNYKSHTYCIPSGIPYRNNTTMLYSNDYVHNQNGK